MVLQFNVADPIHSGAIFDVRLVAYEPNGPRLGLLPQPLSLQAAFPLNDVGALTVEYSKHAINGTILDRPLSHGLEFAVEISNSNGEWVEPRGGRFYWIGSKFDQAEAGDIISIQAPNYAGLLSKVAMLDLDNLLPTGDPNAGKRPFEAVSAGVIIKTLQQENSERNGVPITVGNVTMKDSAGANWERLTVQYLDLGVKTLDVLRMLSDQGLCDWTTRGRELLLFNPDKNVAGNREILRLHAGLDITEAPSEESLEDVAGRVLLTSERARMVLSNPEAPTPFGVWEEHLNQGGIEDEPSAMVAIQAELERRGRIRGQYTRGVNVASRFIPLVDYRVGDWITAPTNQKAETVRVAQVTLTRDANGIVGANLVLNDRVLDAELRRARKQQQIVGGAILGSSSGPVTRDPIDTRTPGKVTGLVVTSDAYLDGGYPRANLRMAWGSVNKATDGTAMEIVGYDIEVDGVIVRSADHSPAAFGPRPCGQTVTVRVRARGRFATTPGEWSDPIQHTTASDTTPPSAPSKPLVKYDLGVIVITWDGKTVNNARMPDDFAAVRVYREGHAVPVATITEYDGASAALAGYPKNERVRFYLTAIDRSGNESAKSAYSDYVTPTLLVPPDLGDPIREEIDNWIRDNAEREAQELINRINEDALLSTGMPIVAQRPDQSALDAQALALAQAMRSGSITQTVSYATGTSATSHPASGWQATVPATTDSRPYVWTRITTLLPNGSESVAYSVGGKGADGAPGRPAETITNVTPQYYLSTSNTTPAGGSWASTIPVWTTGKYYWERLATTYSNNTTTYSTAVLSDFANTATAALLAGQNAQTSADGKNAIKYQTTNPTAATPGKPGDIVFVWNAATGIIARQFICTAGTGSATNNTWVKQAVDNEVIAGIDAGKITAGELDAARIGVNTLTGATLQTDSRNKRGIKISGTVNTTLGTINGLVAYDSNNDETFRVGTADGSVTITGGTLNLIGSGGNNSLRGSAAGIVAKDATGKTVTFGTGGIVLAGTPGNNNSLVLQNGGIYAKDETGRVFSLTTDGLAIPDGALAASKVLIGAGANVVADGTFATADRAWVNTSTQVSFISNLESRGAGLPYSAHNGCAAMFAQGPSVAQYVVREKPYAPASPSSSWRLSAWIYASRQIPASGLYLRVSTVTESGTSAVAVTPQNVNTIPAGKWTYVVSTIGTVGADAAGVRAQLGLTDQTPANTNVFVTDVKLINAADASLVVDGAIDGKTITGALIRTAESGNRIELTGSGSATAMLQGYGTGTGTVASGNVGGIRERVRLTGSALRFYDPAGNLQTSIDGEAAQIIVTGTAGAASSLVINSNGITARNANNDVFRLGPTGLTLPAGVIKSSHIDTNSITTEHLQAGALDAYVITLGTGGVIQTNAAASTGLKINNNGIRGYNANKEETFTVNTAGVATITGGVMRSVADPANIATGNSWRLTAAAGLQFYGIRTNGTAGLAAQLSPAGRLQFWNNSGTNTVDIDGTGGTFTGAAFTGGTFTGALFRANANAHNVLTNTAGTGTGVNLDNTGLLSWDGAFKTRISPDGFSSWNVTSKHYAGVTEQASGQPVQLIVGKYTSNPANWSIATNQPRAALVSDGTVYAWDANQARPMLHSNWAVGSVEYFTAKRIYDRTNSAAANVYVDSDGSLYRTTSVRASKTLIEDAPEEWADAVMRLRPRTWFDKNEVENVLLGTAGAGRALNDKTENWMKSPNNVLAGRIPGFVAEEVEETGLTEFCTYDEDGELTGLSYDRFAAALVMHAQRLQKQVDDLTGKVEMLLIA